MQSSNEELEASKEELQSLNEELNTVNTELTTKMDALDRANGDLQNLFESTQIPTVFLDRKLTIRSFTPTVKDLFNILPGDRGRPITDLTSRLELPDFVDDIKSVFDAGEIIERQIDHPANDTHFLLRLAPYRGFEARIDGVVITFLDVTRLTKVQAHQQVLIAELNHRVKNMLMVAISIAQQTYKTTPKPQAFMEAFVGRLQSMARAYDLLSRENWTESALGELIATELAPFGAERVKIDGPTVNLKPNAALSIGMVIHELATNAAKHGALSVPDGAVEITWSWASPDDTGHLSLFWRERGGPNTTVPARTGFGLKLIDREAAYNLGGSADVQFETSGLEARLTIPAHRL